MEKKIEAILSFTRVKTIEDSDKKKKYCNDIHPEALLNHPDVLVSIKSTLE